MFPILSGLKNFDMTVLEFSCFE